MRLLLVVIGLCALACGAPERQQWENTFTGMGEDAFLVDDDFVCFSDARWQQVDNLFIFNALDHQEDAVALAQSGAEGTYPIGTVVQLGPSEAMVKRGVGFSADTGDWEFLQFHVDSDTTVITARGTTELANLGGTCLSCHAPAKSFDFVCATNEACAPLPFFVDTDTDPATEDPRCR